MRIGLMFLLAIGVLACSSSRQDQLSSSEPGFAQQLTKYEASFHPSDFDPDPGQAVWTATDKTPNVDKPVADTTAPTTGEIIRGFRVQLFSSGRIDEARDKKAEVEVLFPSEWFYLEYESPTYKIRAGNFLTRFDAEKFIAELDGKGYRDAWIVPSRVLKNPPPPPPPVIH